MELRRYLAALVLSLYCSCSYSETINGTTSNAANLGLNWTMSNVLPAATGLTVDGVIYQYTAVKNTNDAMNVSVQNKNAIESGYVFRSRDDWTGLPGNTITKVVPVNNIPNIYWGDGSISIEGKGEVKNPSVFYKYRYDTCVDPLSDPSCPGYAAAMLKQLTDKAAEPIDPLSDPNIKKVLETKAVLEEEKKTSIENEKKGIKPSTDKKLITHTLSPDDIQKALQLEMLNNIPGFDLYRIPISGGVYNDVLRYPDKKLPDSSNSRRLGMAQESLHKSMIELQYNKN